MHHLEYIVPFERKYPMGHATLVITQLEQEISCLLVITKKNLEASYDAPNDITKMKQINLRILELLCMNGTEPSELQIEKVEKYENIIDDMQKKDLKRQMKRVKKGNCKPEAGILFSELLTDFERIGDHALNIAQLSVDTSL